MRVRESEREHRLREKGRGTQREIQERIERER